MELSALQKEGLTELINIAFSRTAASLSELTGNRVELEVPEITVCTMSELFPTLSRFVSGDVATVHQIFAGPVAGDALLLLNHEGAVNLIELLTGEIKPGRRLAASSKEVLSEVGNILLNACMGIFGDLLPGPLQVPHRAALASRSSQRLARFAGHRHGRTATLSCGGCPLRPSGQPP